MSHKSSRPKLLICAPRLFVHGETGGGERYTTEFVRALRRRDDFDISVASGVNYRGIQLRDTETFEVVQTLNTLQFGRLVAGSDIVHLFQLDSRIADLTLVAGELTRVPVILTDLGGGWRAVGRLFGRRRHRCLSGLAAISKTSVVDLGWNERRPTTILFGGGDHLEPIGEVEKRFDFVFVGRLVEHKGVHLLLEALPADATCLIAGAPVDDGYVRRLMDFADPQQVTFHIGPTDDDVVRAYRSATWSVCPTLARVDGKKLRRPELLGLSPLESVSLGTPVVLSDISAYAELAAQLGMPKFSANSVSSLRETLEMVMSERKVSLADKQFKFSWDSVADRAVRLYGTALST